MYDNLVEQSICCAETSIYKKRISLDKERSFFYFFFFSVGWLCLAKLDESSKFGCFLPALLLLPFPICNAPPLILTIPYKKILLHPGGFFYFLLLIIPNCSRSTSNTPGSAIPSWIVLTIALMVIIIFSLIKNSLRMNLILAMN